MQNKIPSRGGILRILFLLGLFGLLKGKKRDDVEIIELNKGEKNIQKLQKLIKIMEDLEKRKEQLVIDTHGALDNLRRTYLQKSQALFAELSSMMEQEDLHLEDILDNYYEKNMQLKSWLDSNSKILKKTNKFFPEAINEIIYKIQKRMLKVSTDAFIEELAFFLIRTDADKGGMLKVYAELSRLNKTSLKANFEAFIMDQNEEVKILEALMDRESNALTTESDEKEKEIRKKKIQIFEKQQKKIKEILAKLELFLATLEQQNTIVDKVLLQMRTVNFNIGENENHVMLREASNNLKDSMEEHEKPFVEDLKQDQEVLKELWTLFEGMKNIEEEK